MCWVADVAAERCHQQTKELREAWQQSPAQVQRLLHICPLMLAAALQCLLSSTHNPGPSNWRLSWAVPSWCSPPVPPPGPPVCSVCEPTIAPLPCRLLQGEAGNAPRDGKAVRVQGGTAAPAGQAAERAPERPRRDHEGALPALRCAVRAANWVSLVLGSTAAPRCNVCGGYAGCGSMEAGHIARSLGRGSVVADSNSTAVGCPRLLMMRGSIHCGLPGAGD